MSDLRTIPTTTEVLPKVGAARFFADQRRQSRLWMIAFLVSATFSHLQWFFPRHMDPEWVAVVDAEGTVIRTRLVGFKSATRLHERHARMATTAFLNRGVLEVDDPALLEVVFLPDALAQANRQIEFEKQEREAKQVHQKAEIGSVAILEARNDRVLVHVEGQLLRLGFFRGNRFSETLTFSLNLTLQRNPDMSRNERFPLAVSQFTYESNSSTQ